MTTLHSSQSGSPPASALLATPSDAQKFANSMTDTMTALLQVVELETALVRAGQLRDALTLEARKTELSRSYIHAASHLKTNHAYMVKSTPDLLKALRSRHDTFRSSLQVNLTVLATAHAVSEGIVRGVNAEMQRRAAPSTYTASGSQSVPNARHAAPLAISRTL
jgi:hypothetical protein